MGVDGGEAKDDVNNMKGRRGVQPRNRERHGISQLGVVGGGF